MYIVPHRCESGFKAGGVVDPDLKTGVVVGPNNSTDGGT